MSIWNFLSGGVISSVERLASEFIETDMESAEAKALMVKTLDPNGLMRRKLSTFACWAYGFYLVTTVILIFIHSFADVKMATQSMQAITAMTELFLPITGSWAAIVTASFGVNATNSFKDRK